MSDNLMKPKNAFIFIEAAPENIAVFARADLKEIIHTSEYRLTIAQIRRNP
jgi:hypothetical protein